MKFENHTDREIASVIAFVIFIALFLFCIGKLLADALDLSQYLK